MTFVFLLGLRENVFCIASSLIYHNQIAVHVPGGDDAVNRVAKRSGLRNLGRIGDLQDFYLLESHLINKRQDFARAISDEYLFCFNITNKIDIKTLDQQINHTSITSSLKKMMKFTGLSSNKRRRGRREVPLILLKR